MLATMRTERFQMKRVNPNARFTFIRYKLRPYKQKDAYTSKAYRRYIEYLDLKYLGSTIADIINTNLRWKMNRTGFMRRFFSPNYVCLHPDELAYNTAKCTYSPKRVYRLTVEQEAEYRSLLAKAKTDKILGNYLSISPLISRKKGPNEKA